MVDQNNCSTLYPAACFKKNFYFNCLAMFKKFKAQIHGSFVISTNGQQPIDKTIEFTKTRIILKEEQLQRIFLDPFAQNALVYHGEYKLDKLLNKMDEKQFSIVLTNRMNNLDTGIHHLDINWWNKIKANIIHHRYWIDREKEWFAKTIISTLIGFLFGIVGAYMGYKLAKTNSKPPSIQVNQSAK